MNNYYTKSGQSGNNFGQNRLYRTNSMPNNVAAVPYPLTALESSTQKIRDIEFMLKVIQTQNETQDKMN